MSRARPQVSVVVSCRDDADALELTLDDLFAQVGASWEAVVVDVASIDEGARARLQALRWPGTRTLRVEAGGGVTAAQAGVAVTLAPALLFLSAGDRLEPPALSALWAALEVDPGAVVARPAAAPGATAATRLAGLVRRSALTPTSLEADDPAAALEAGGARCASVDGSLVRPAAWRTPPAQPPVRARVLFGPSATLARASGPAAPGSRGPTTGAPASLELGEAVRRLEELSSALREARHDIAALRTSGSWRITAPLRLVHRWLTRTGR